MNDDALINCGGELTILGLPVPRPMRCSKYRGCIGPDRKTTVAGRNPERSSGLLHARWLSTPDRRDRTSPHPHRSAGTFSHIVWAAAVPEGKIRTKSGPQEQ